VFCFVFFLITISNYSALLNILFSLHYSGMQFASVILEILRESRLKLAMRLSSRSTSR